MTFAGWDEEEEAEYLDEGLKLLGWRFDGRLTSEDKLMLSKVVDEAIEKQDEGCLALDDIDRLALEAFEILHFQVMNSVERAMFVTNTYSESANLRPLVPLIDQSLLCYYRGYFTASLAILFIVIENYLRSLKGWKPGDKDPSFAELKKAVLTLPASDARDDAKRIIDIIYVRYDATAPPQFYFNRHGLLHGLREQYAVDRLNCVRMYLLLDSFARAEDLERGGLITTEFHLRAAIYGRCTVSDREMMFLYPK